MTSNSKLIDVKATKRQPWRWRFSKSNRHRDKATTYVFTSVEEVGNETWVTLKGWTERNELKTCLKEDQRSFFVRYSALCHAGVLRPVKEFMQPLSTINRRQIHYE